MERLNWQLIALNLSQVTEEQGLSSNDVEAKVKVTMMGIESLNKQSNIHVLDTEIHSKDVREGQACPGILSY